LLFDKSEVTSRKNDSLITRKLTRQITGNGNQFILISLGEKNLSKHIEGGFRTGMTARMD